MRKLLFLSVAIIGSLILLSCGSTDSTTNYQISISASPSEGGTVSPSSGQYEEGTSLDILATPSDEYRFVEWQGDYSGSSSSATITVGSDKNIQAIFTKKEYALTVNTEGEGTVDESVLQTTSTNDYESGTIVELTANPAEGWQFKEWQGDITSTENPTQVTVGEAKEVIAAFDRMEFKTPQEGLFSDFYASFTFADSVGQAMLSLRNSLPNPILLKRIIVKRGDESVYSELTANQTINSDSTVFYGLKFGRYPTFSRAVTIEKFNKYTVEWICLYKEEIVKKMGTVSVDSSDKNQTTKNLNNTIQKINY